MKLLQYPIEIWTAPLAQKKYVWIFGITILFFLSYHGVVWTFMTSKIFLTSNNHIGDLGRTSYLVDSLFPRLIEDTLPRKHFDGNNWNNGSVDLITIGDSFSNGGGGGKNAYYQDYLATVLNINVLNIQNIGQDYSYIDTIRFLHQKKYFGKIKPKAILIQAVVRESLRDVPTKEINPTSDILLQNLLAKNTTAHFPHPLWINTANYRAPYYYTRYFYSIRAKKEIYRLLLTKDLFTSNDRNHLLVYHDDLNNITKFNKKNIANLNAELNLLAQELQKENIKLIFMPVVDKYDLYHDYILDQKRYPLNPFFTLLRKEPKSYTLIDSKAILLPMLKNNVQDLYYSDDTHWSYKASEAIANSSGFLFLQK